MRRCTFMASPLHASLRRARARRQSDGAVMFIVVVTLGLLAVMGVYGLTAAQGDLVAARHMREAVQGQKAGEHALMLTAETFNPAAAKALVEAMSGPKRTRNCRTATGAGGVPASVAPFADVSYGTSSVPASAACLRLNEAEMRVVSTSINLWVAAVPGFAIDSFGPRSIPGGDQALPITLVEIANPVDVPPPPGSGYDPTTQRFTQVTVTVFVDVRPPGAPVAMTVVAGRGRFTVGPITGSAAAY